MEPAGKLKLAVLSSSRADFGIYLPLLKKINREKDRYCLKFIAFGTHLSKMHGYTKVEMTREGFAPDFEIVSLLSDDRPEDISSGYAITNLKFATFWAEHKFDLVFCLGDRFEMAAAVNSGIPLGVKFAHIHGGETTLGAIDNIYRHFITLASSYHFVSTKPFAERIKDLIQTDKNVFVSGALGLDNIDEISLLSINEFKEKWQIDLDYPSILITIHPETVNFEKNLEFANESKKALLQLSERFQLIITMPNADTNGKIYRNMFTSLKALNPLKIHLIENFGTQSYFTCMNHVNLLIGNTSSGIVEAASFHKFVLNLGDRQKGRLTNHNVIHLPFISEQIIANSNKYSGMTYSGNNIYKTKSASEKILNVLRKISDGELS